MNKVCRIKGYENYLIDDASNVFRISGEKLIKKKSTVASNGYELISLWKNNVGKWVYIHRLMLQSFVSDCPENHEALHINGNRLDNSLENLRWGTRKENVADAIRHGTATIGSKNGAAKLTKSDVLFLLDMKKMGFTAKESSQIFKVSPNTIQRVYSGITYKKEARQ